MVVVVVVVTLVGGLLVRCVCSSQVLDRG
jgi:hypothetical protein